MWKKCYFFLAGDFLAVFLAAAFFAGAFFFAFDVAFLFTGMNASFGSIRGFVPSQASQPPPLHLHQWLALYAESDALVNRGRMTF